MNIPTSIAPWLTVTDGEAAIAFYKAAFGAVETYRLDEPGSGVVVTLSIGGAAFWVSSGTDQNKIVSSPEQEGEPVRFILTVSNPDEVFDKALKAGAKEIFPVGEGYGWRLGRLADPFGFHWEIGYPLLSGS